VGGRDGVTDTGAGVASSSRVHPTTPFSKKLFAGLIAMKFSVALLLIFLILYFMKLIRKINRFNVEL
jgi:hypothetical protein